MTKAKKARILNVQELICCWGLGLYQFEAKLLQVRAERGLPQLPLVDGLNSDACVKRPRVRADDEGEVFGATNKRYLALRGRYFQAWSNWPRAGFCAAAGLLNEEQRAEAGRARSEGRPALDERWEVQMRDGMSTAST